jgi:hypothetical protein
LEPPPRRLAFNTGKEKYLKGTERLHLAGKFMIMEKGWAYFSSKEKSKSV